MTKTTNAPAADEWAGMDDQAKRIAELKEKAKKKADTDPASPEAAARKAAKTPDPAPKIAPEKPAGKAHKQTGKPVVQASTKTSKPVTVPGEPVKEPKRSPKTPQEIADEAAEKARKEALKVAEKAAKEKADAAAKAAKEKAEADAKKKRDHDLEQAAKEIVVRMTKAREIETAAGVKADDHRLAAALKLGEAKRLCEEAKIKFADWHKSNVGDVVLSFDEARKLAAIGVSGDVAKATLALADLRAGAAKRNKKLRDKKAAEQKKKSKKPEAKSRPGGSKQEIALSEDADKLRGAFEALSGSDQEDFLTWAAESIGATVEFAG